VLVTGLCLGLLSAPVAAVAQNLGAPVILSPIAPSMAPTIGRGGSRTPGSTSVARWARLFLQRPTAR